MTILCAGALLLLAVWAALTPELTPFITIPGDFASTVALAIVVLKGAARWAAKHPLEVIEVGHKGYKYAGRRRKARATSEGRDEKN